MLPFVAPKQAATQNPEHQTPNTKHQTPKPPKSQNQKPKTPKPQSPKAPNPKPKLQVSIPAPQTTNPKPQILMQNPKPQTPNPKPQTPNLKPQTSNLEPKTPNPNPKASAHTCFCQARLGRLALFPFQVCPWLLAAYCLYVAVTASSYIAFFASLLTALVAVRYARDSKKELSFFVAQHFPALGRACGSISPSQVFPWLLTAYPLHVAATASSHGAAVLGIVVAVTAALVALDSDPHTLPVVLSGRMLLFALYSIYSAATVSSFFLSAAWFLVAFLVAYFTLLIDFGHRSFSPLEQGRSIFLWMLAAYFVFAAASASSYIFANIWHAAAFGAVVGALEHDAYDNCPVASRELFSIQTAFLYYLTGYFVYFVHAVATASSWLAACAWFCLAGGCFFPIAIVALGFEEKHLVKSLKDGNFGRLFKQKRYVPYAPYLLARVSECMLAALSYRTPLIKRLTTKKEKDQ
jgi:hypothetical protein